MTPWPPPDPAQMFGRAVQWRPWLLTAERPGLPLRMRIMKFRWARNLRDRVRGLVAGWPPAATGDGRRTAPGARPDRGRTAPVASSGGTPATSPARRPTVEPDACRGVGRRPDPHNACPWCHRPAEVDDHGRVRSHRRPGAVVVNVLSPQIGRQG